MSDEDIPLPPEPEECIHGIWPVDSCTICLPRPSDEPPAPNFQKELQVGKMTTARFNGTCKGCGAATYVNSTLMAWDGENWVCQRCIRDSPHPALKALAKKMGS